MSVCSECYTIISEDEGNLEDHKKEAHSIEAFMAKVESNKNRDLADELPEE